MLEGLLATGASPNPWFRPVVLFAIETGMRRGEILSPTWENVHLGKRYVHLPDTKNGDSRDVPLSPQALELLRDLPRNIVEDQVVFPLHFEALKSSWRKRTRQIRVMPTNTTLHLSNTDRRKTL